MRRITTAGAAAVIALGGLVGATGTASAAARPHITATQYITAAQCEAGGGVVMQPILTIIGLPGWCEGGLYGGDVVYDA